MEKSVTFKKANITYYIYGSNKKETIVLLHGFLENASMWKTIVEALSNSHQIISIDLLGHGKTDCLGYTHTMEDMADAVYAILSHLKLKRIILIGHSMGGYVSLAFVDHYPEMVKGLGLANSTAIGDSHEKKLHRDRAIKAVKHNHKSFIRMSIANLFSERTRAHFSEEIETIKKEALKIPLQGIIAALEGMKIRPNRDILFHNTSFKKILIIGKQDPVLEYTTLIEQTKGLDIEIIEFPDGHMSYIENMYDFNYKIIRFIENI